MTLKEELGLTIPFEDVRHVAILNIIRTTAVLSAAGAALFRRFDITEAQFNVLFLLKYVPKPIIQSDLGKRLVVTRASITSVLDKLESKGLVKRHAVPGNRRINHVDLTAAGERLFHRIEPLYRENLHRVMDSFTDSDCRKLTRILEQIREKTTSIFDLLADGNA